MLFSHGLGGSRNAYSHLAGSVASHGVMVITTEHRDGSAPISYIGDTSVTAVNSEKSDAKNSRRTVDYNRISHTPCPEVELARTAQLKIRLWELGCIHDALLKIDNGVDLTNLNMPSVHNLPGFKNKMEVQEPGSIIFAGHSFGAATVVQLVKSTFYSAETANAPASYEPIFTPSPRSAIVQQITSKNPVILLDTWCFSLRFSTTRWLWNKPMPCYAKDGPGGCALLAVESQTFFKWRAHLKATKRLLSPNPASKSYRTEDDGRPAPHFFYPSASAHLSQSDFGILFPWFTRRVFAAEEPVRVMKLNVRAILQLLREQRVPVSATSAADMELESKTNSATQGDSRIFSTEPGVIRGWNYLSINADDLSDVTIDDDSDSDTNSLDANPRDPIKGEEMMKSIVSTVDSLNSENTLVTA
jgi:platelet-activating factor acetylhydrolase